MFKGTSLLRPLFASIVCLCLASLSWAAHITTHTPTKSKSQKISETTRTRRRLHHLARSRSTTAVVTPVSATTRRHRYQERFHMSSFAEDITNGDVIAGEDPV